MEKKYCLLEGDIFQRVCEYEEYLKLKSTNRFIHDVPPVYNDKTHIALFSEDRWHIKRISRFEKERSLKKAEYRKYLKEKLLLTKMEERLCKERDEIPPYISNKVIPNFIVLTKLKKEQSLLQKKLINLFENKKRILKKLKIYNKDLSNKIIELEKDQFSQTSVVFDANNEFQIIDVVPSKVDF